MSEDPQQMFPQRDPPAAQAGTPSGECVLLVDDQPAELRLLAEFLRHQGLRILTALDGRSALRLAREQQPDLILLDLRMPDLDGFTLCRLLKSEAQTRDIPVLFLTGMADEEQKLAGFAHGGVDYITKPFSRAEVLARVQVHLRLRGRIRDTLVPEFSGSGRLAWQLDQARQLLERQLGNPEPPNVAELARAVGLGERRLRDEFRRAYGSTLSGHLREQRMQLARSLLGESRFSVAEVGRRVGYLNQANFATAFRRRFGVPPREIRAGGEGDNDGSA